jgi:hypothetical protein
MIFITPIFNFIKPQMPFIIGCGILHGIITNFSPNTKDYIKPIQLNNKFIKHNFNIIINQVNWAITTYLYIGLYTLLGINLKLLFTPLIKFIEYTKD